MMYRIPLRVVLWRLSCANANTRLVGPDIDSSLAIFSIRTAELQLTFDQILATWGPNERNKLYNLLFCLQSELRLFYIVDTGSRNHLIRPEHQAGLMLMAS